MSDKKNAGLTRRTSGLMALEPRFMFDGAAVADAVSALVPVDAAHDGGLLQFANGADKAVVALNTAQQEAQRIVADYLQRPDATQQLFALFNGGQTTPSAQWQQAANDLLAQVRDNTLSVRVEMRSSAELQGALGAFAAHGLDGHPVIYLNANYVQTASSAAIEAVLIEEIGHAIDARLNPGSDSPGDEGHAFASLLITGDANLNAVLGENDHQTLQIDSQAVAVEEAGPYGIAQVHFVPLPENDLQTAQKAIAGATAVSGNENTVIAITATADNTVIVYDHWEDGYEADITNPVQSTTQIWGDGNTANGTAPGTTDDIVHAGQTILLQNAVNPASPLTLDYDGRDKIGSTQAVSVVRAGWSATPGTVLAGAVSVIDSGNAGKNYVIPIGENVDTVATGTNRLFEYTSLHIIATEDNTVVNLDLAGDGTFETTITLAHQGDTYFVNGGVKAGAHITSDKGIGVYVVAGDVGSAYENRWFAITPREQWSSSYYAPVSTTLAADPSCVIVYNPNTTAIDVYYDTATSTGNKITVPANVANGVAGTNYVMMPASAAHFYTRDGSKFYAVGVIDADATSNATHDWSYSLVPDSYLTSKFVVGWGPGYDLSAGASYLDGSPVWVTATDDTTIYIDNGSLASAPGTSILTVKDAAGNAVTGYQVGSSTTWRYEVAALQSYRIFDNSDKNQSGLTVYTTDGTLITAAWGEDPSIAGAGTPYLDMGTTVLPFPDYVFSKTSVEASPATYGNTVSNGNTSVELGEQIEYTLTVTNRAVIDLYNVNIKDAISAASAGAASYVANSTTIKIIRADGTVVQDTTLIPDDNLGTSPFPLAKLDGGYTLTDADPTTVGNQGLKRGDQVIIKYRVQLSSSVAALAAAGFTVTNDAEMTGNPAGTNTAIDPKKVTDQTIININGTYDGTVKFKDSVFSGVASNFQEGQTIGIEVTDNDANRSSSQADTLSVVVTNTVTGEKELVTLTETGINTNVFRNTLTTSTAASVDNDGALQMRTGDTIKVDYTDPVYGVAFDNPTNPGVAGDADNNIATGSANTAYASVPVPSQTKILYLSDDTTNNLDRVLPPSSDTTAASTASLVTASNGALVSITDNFGTNTSSTSYSTGSGWLTSWSETGDGSTGAGSGGVYIRATSNDNALYFNSINGAGVSRTFSALGSSATLTFDVKDGSTTSSKNYEAGDYIKVEEYGSDNQWHQLGTVDGSIITGSYSAQTFTVSAGATGIRFTANISGGDTDRAYIDNVKITTGGVSTASTSGATDFALSASVSAGQSFTLVNSGSSADAVAIDQLTLSLKKTGTTPATATVSIRNAWDGAVLWSGTVSTSQLSTSYQDVTLTPTGLVLDKSGTYVIRVDSNASGVVWQGNTSNSYADGTRLSSSGTAVSTSDMRFAVKGHESGLTSVSFTQSQSMATDFTLPAGGVIKVVTYVTNETGITTGDSITADLSSNGVSFATSNSPVYDGTAHTLTWTFTALGSAKTIAAGQAITLKVTNSSSNAGDSFKIAYDSYATPSRIELPTNTVINLVDADPVTAGVQEVAFFDKSILNGGNPITGGFANAGDIVYIRVKVADPFGDYDISSLDLTINGPDTVGDITLNMANAYVVNATNDGRAYKTYEYAWQTVYNVGSYSIGVVAHEGSEGTVTDSATASLLVTETDLGTPSTTMFRTQLEGNGGVEAGAVYDSGSRTYLRVTDLDNSGSAFPTVTATVSDGVNSYTVTLTQIGTSGIFEADLGDPAVHGGNTTAAAYFAALPNGVVLTARYTDPNDSTDSSSDAIVVNTPPTAVNNSLNIGMDKQATGNAITDNTGAGVDSDPNASQTLTVIDITDGTHSLALNDTVTLPSGARLLVKSDGSYIYDPSSLTNPPTVGNPVTDSFTYTISDGHGGTATATVTLTVDYVDPTVIDNQSSTDGQIIEFDVSNKFTDIQYIDFQYSATSLPSGLSIDPVSGLITGTIAANASTSVGQNDYLVSVTIVELDSTGTPTGLSTTRDFSWMVSNVAPVAVDDAKSTAMDTVITGSVLSNDHDGAPDSDALSVSMVGTDISALNHYPTGMNIATLHGTVRINNYSTGNYTYIPNAGYTGTDSFFYTIIDGNGGVSRATVAINIIGVNNVSVNEGSPYAVFTVSGAANEQVSLTLANGAAVMDTNGVPLFDGSEDYGPTLEYSSDNGANWSYYSSGTVALNGSGALLVRTSVINDTLYEGPQTFTLNASDALGTSAAGTGTIRDDGTGQWFDGTGGTGSNIAPNGQVFNDDRPSFSINDVTINEAAGTMTFIVTKTGSTALASSVNWATADDTATAGSDYTAANGTLNFAAGDSTKTVTVSVTNDAVYEGAESFRINLTNASSAVAGDNQGIGTIKDDGTGGNGTNDDRTLSVNNISVNEGSPYGVFTVTANIGETLTLALNNGSANGSGTDYGSTGADGHAALEYSTDGGSTWTTYTTGFTVPGSGTGTVSVLVRSSITNDATYEGAETFTLNAAYSSGVARSQTGTATIHDDGTGQWFDGTGGTGANTAPNGSTLNDDRAITVGGLPDVSEGSNAVFRVTLPDGNARNTEISLALSNVSTQSTDYNPIFTAYYFDAQNVKTDLVIVNGKIVLPSGVTGFYVNVATTQDGELEGPESLRLTATITGGKSANDISTIVDDGSGHIYDVKGLNPTGPGDDDRAKPTAPPPAPTLPPAPAKSAEPLPPPLTAPPQAFASALQPLAPRVAATAELPLSMVDVKTSASGYQIPVNETAAPGLTIYRGVTDQFVQSTQIATKISLPFDAFIHSNKDAVIKLEAKQADNSSLPKWVQFDPATGVFEVAPPKGFKGKIDLKVIARDEDGREATAIFQMFVGEQTQNQTPGLQSRHSFSEKLRMAGKRPVTLVRVAEVRTPAHAREAVVVKVHAG